MKKSMKENITETSVNLFNKKGSHSITTNHIISEMQISPGTFYYHFKNKEEIIRKIFDIIAEEFQTVMNDFVNNLNINGIVSTLKKMFSLYYKYRFFYIEISTLLDRDKDLEKTYRKNLKHKKEKIILLFTMMEENNILRKGFTASDDFQYVFSILWIISDYWISYLKIYGDFDENKVCEGYKYYLHILKPYCSNEALKEISEYL